MLKWFLEGLHAIVVLVLMNGVFLVSIFSIVDLLISFGTGKKAWYEKQIDKFTMWYGMHSAVYLPKLREITTEDREEWLSLHLNEEELNSGEYDTEYWYYKAINAVAKYILQSTICQENYLTMKTNWKRFDEEGRAHFRVSNYKGNEIKIKFYDQDLEDNFFTLELPLLLQKRKPQAIRDIRKAIMTIMKCAKKKDARQTHPRRTVFGSIIAYCQDW